MNAACTQPKDVAGELAAAGSPTAAADAPRILTKPSVSNRPNCRDNINDDLIVAVGDVFVSSLGIKYTVQSMLGQGTFGQVFKCSVQDSGETVAIKVIKNQPAYYHQARVEIGILQFLNTRADPGDQSHLVRLKDFFVHCDHLCLVFELLGLNLFELVRHNKFRGLSLPLVRVFITQVLEALVVLHASAIIHCDLKPENILLTNSASGDIKLIDFGSACFANRTVYSYIQSRFYRSPEVVLGHQYSTAVDMWSLGCVAAELFLGLPLFPAACEHDLLSRMLDTLGPLPDHLLRQGKHSGKYFTGAHPEDAAELRLRTPEEFQEVTGQKAPRGKQYFQHKVLLDIIDAYPIKSGLNDVELTRERSQRQSFTNFLLGLLDLDPLTRWSPRQALQHPFITGEPFRGVFQPTPDDNEAFKAVSAGLPVRIPQRQQQPSQQQQPSDASPRGWPMPVPTAAMMATSPQMHAQAHAAAMAAVQMQMSLGGNFGSVRGAAPGTSPYAAAHSLQRIMMPMYSNASGLWDGTDASALAQQQQQQHYQQQLPQGSLPGSLPAPLLSPPSRSFGVHLAPMATDLPAPSFDVGSQGHARVMPLMQLPGGSYGQQQSHAFFAPSSFQPSSVNTFRSVLAAAGPPFATGAGTGSAGIGAGAGTSAVSEPRRNNFWGDLLGRRAGCSIGDEIAATRWSGQETNLSSDLAEHEESSTPRKGRSTPMQEETPNPADWDPFFPGSDDLLKEDETSPSQQQEQSKQQHVVVIDPVSQAEILKAGAASLSGGQQCLAGGELALAVQHLTQLQALNTDKEQPTDESTAPPPAADASNTEAEAQQGMLWSPARVDSSGNLPLEQQEQQQQQQQPEVQTKRLQGFDIL